jgi:hypothetical protein
MSRSYYAWNGIGAIEEDDFEDSDDDSIIRFFLAWAAARPGTWTLWARHNDRNSCPELLAISHTGSPPWISNPITTGSKEATTESDMGTRQQQDGGGHPRQPNTHYEVNLGDVHRALRGILTECGLNRTELDRLIKEYCEQRMDERMRNWIHQQDNLESRMLDRLEAAIMADRSHSAGLRNTFLALLRERIDVMLRDYARIELFWPPREVEPSRRIRREQSEGGEQHEPDGVGR